MSSSSSFKPAFAVGDMVMLPKTDKFEESVMYGVVQAVEPGNGNYWITVRWTFGTEPLAETETCVTVYQSSWLRHDGREPPDTVIALRALLLLLNN